MTLMATLVLSPGWWGLGKYFFFSEGSLGIVKEEKVN